MTKAPIITNSLHFYGFDPDQLLEVIQGAQFEHYILTRMQCSGHFSRWSCGAFTVDNGRYNFPVRAVGAFPQGRHCIGYMRSPAEPTWVNGFQVTRNTMEFYPEDTELNYRAHADGEWVAVTFEKEALQAAARRRLGHELDLPWRHVVSFCPPARGRAALDRMIRGLWRHPVSGALMIDPILEIIAEFLDGHGLALPDNGHARWLRRQGMLKRADQFLRANLATPFNLRVLASAVGATERTLQREFLNAYGLTPLEWARCLALHQARQRLRASNGLLFTVAGIAQECGFRHMGRFAGYYQDLFGESPSETLHKPR